MATLRERKNYRQAIMKMLYEATEGDRLLGVTGARLRDDLQVPEQDLAAACASVVSEADHRRLGAGKHTRDGDVDASGGSGSWRPRRRRRG